MRKIAERLEAANLACLTHPPSGPFGSKISVKNIFGAAQLINFTYVWIELVSVVLRSLALQVVVWMTIYISVFIWKKILIEISRHLIPLLRMEVVARQILYLVM